MKRGLYKSKTTNQLTNADLNDSFNILKKHLTKNVLWNEKIFQTVYWDAVACYYFFNIIYNLVKEIIQKVEIWNFLFFRIETNCNEQGTNLVYCELLWMDADDLMVGLNHLLKIGTKIVPVTINKIQHCVDIKIRQHLPKKK